MPFFFTFISDVQDSLSKTKYFSSVAIAIAYHQVRIAKGDIHKIAFFTNEGLYEYILMPFGL